MLPTSPYFNRSVPVGASRCGPYCIRCVKTSFSSPSPSATISDTVLIVSSIRWPHVSIVETQSANRAPSGTTGSAFSS
jgi:hypothetical protein